MSKKISELTSLALERTHVGDKGFEFETFGQNLCRCTLGENFFATAPFKDDSIDGFYIRIDEDLIVTKQGRPEIIYQFGTTSKYADKIRNTYKDLKEKQINIKKIHYYTPHRISQITKHIDELEEELDIAIVIVDSSQICAMAANQECKHIFQGFIVSILGPLESKDDKNIQLDYPVLYLNAWYRYENSGEHTKAITKMADSLIIWALRKTDPDKKCFMSADQIYSAIEKDFPSAKTTIKSMFEFRLKTLQKRRTEYGRDVIQKHKSGFCLPLESRQSYEKKDEESREILLLVKASFSNRLDSIGINSPRKEQVSELMLHTIKHVFTERGVRFVESLTAESNDSYDEIYLRDAVKNASNDLETYAFKSKELTNASITLRKVFARPDKYEQEYLTRTSYLYMMHYIMHNDIGIVSYFQERTKRLNLIVHSDVLIRALSEVYLHESGQHYRNMLAYLNSMGANLLMTEESLMEIYMNFRIAGYEYQNHIQNFENHFTLASIKFLPVLMTRAYLYSKKEGKVTTWEQFIDNFCTPQSLFNDASKAKEDLRIYLTDKFSLHILRTDEVENDINTDLSNQLKDIIKPYKKRDELAKHVANINIYVSTLRHKNKEVSKSPFGYQTYWLTHEKTAYTIAEEFFNKHDLGRRLIMRPEFIMQQIMLTPDQDSIAKSYSATFPTALGIQMSQQLDIKTFHVLMKKLNDICQHDESRAKAILNEVIQVASEETQLTQNMDYYDAEELPRDTIEWNGDLKDKLQTIIEQADKRQKKEL